MATAAKPPDPFAAMGGGVYQNGGWKPRNMFSAAELSAYDNQEAAGPAAPVQSPAAPPTASAPSPVAPTTPDPFAAMGGGVYENGGWKPLSMVQPAAPAPSAPAPSAPVPSTPASTDPFAAMGGGVQVNGGWVPANHPNARLPGAQPSPGVVIPPDPLRPPIPTLSPGQGPAAPPGSAPAAGPQTPTSTAAPLATNAAQISTPFYQTLHGLLSQQNPVTENDPQVKNALNAARAEEERNFARARSQAAESAAADGTSMSGGFNAGLMNARAGIGARQGQLASDLVRQQQSDRMAQIMSALAIGQGIMSDSDKNQLQRELADLDAALRRQGFEVDLEDIGSRTALGREDIGLRRELGTQDTALRRDLGLEDINLRRYLGDQATGFNYAQLNQQGDQFGERLAADTGMFQDELANRLLLALMSGGEV